MKRLDKETEEKLYLIVKENYPQIKQFKYEISESRNCIALSQEVEIPDDPKIYEDIGRIEKLLNVTFSRISIIHGRHSFVYIFND